MTADGIGTATEQQIPRRMFGVAVPPRRVRWVMAAFAALCIALVVGAPQRRVGDGGEYMAMTWNLSHFRPPALTLEDIERFDQHYRSLEPQLSRYVGSVPMLDDLRSGGRYDMLHFWTYSLAATPFAGLANVLGIPETYGFAALNILLATLMFGLVLRRCGAVAAAILCCSPLWWWLDKPHPEIFVGATILVALLWRHDRPQMGLIAAALAMSQNIALGPMFGIYAMAVALEHRNTLLATKRHRALLAVAALVAVVHPAYYLVRLGSIDATTAALGQGLRVPDITRLTTPVLDPYIGLITWWPGLLVVAAIGGSVAAWRRVPRHRTATEWALAWAPALMALALLFGQAQNAEPGSGGTFAMSRYTIWLAPFAVAWIRRDLFSAAVLRRGLPVLLVASALLSFHVARPSREDVWFTAGPNWVSDAVNEHAPWLWNPKPQVFLTREWHQFGTIAPVANEACTKLLAVAGAWPSTCETPLTVPVECSTAPFCYANWSGGAWWFRPEPSLG